MSHAADMHTDNRTSPPYSRQALLQFDLPGAIAQSLEANVLQGFEKLTRQHATIELHPRRPSDGGDGIFGCGGVSVGGAATVAWQPLAGALGGRVAAVCDPSGRRPRRPATRPVSPVLHGRSKCREGPSTTGS
jgi:hypothetical protein